MCRKLPDFATVIIPICMEWMTTIEDEEAWYTTENLDEEDSNEENYIVAEQAMDRLARHLGGKTVLPVAFTIIPRYLSSQNWTERHAALMTISNIGEGCAKIMETELPNIINSVVPHLRDPHPRVRYAACNAIGQMSTDFAVSISYLSSMFAEVHFFTKHLGLFNNLAQNPTHSPSTHSFQPRTRHGRYRPPSCANPRCRSSCQFRRRSS